MSGGPDAFSNDACRTPQDAAVFKVLLADIRQGSSPPACLAAVQLMARIVGNCVAHPGEDKYLAVRASQEAFRAKVWGVPGCRRYLEATGFWLQGTHVRLSESTPPATLLRSLDALRTAELDLHQAVAQQKQDAVSEAHYRATLEEHRRARHQERCLEINAAMEAEEANEGVAAELARLPPALLDSLTALLRNVLLNRDDPQHAARYCTLRCSNPKVKELLDSPAAADVLCYCGFGSGAGGTFTIEPQLGDPGLQPRVAGALKTLEEALRLSVALAEEAAEAEREGHRLLRQRGAPRAAQPPAPLGPMSESRKEEVLTATQLVSDVQGLMEQDWLLRGAVGYEAGFRKQGRQLLEQHTAGELTLRDLHDLKEVWEGRVEQTKAKTGRTMLSTIYAPNDPEGKPHPSTFVGKNV